MEKSEIESSTTQPDKISYFCVLGSCLRCSKSKEENNTLFNINVSRSTVVSSATRGQGHGTQAVKQEACSQCLEFPNLESPLCPMSGSECTTYSRLSWSQQSWFPEMTVPTCLLGETIAARNATPEGLGYGLSLQGCWSTKPQLKGS